MIHEDAAEIARQEREVQRIIDGINPATDMVEAWTRIAGLQGCTVATQRIGYHMTAAEHKRATMNYLYDPPEVQ